MKNIGHKFLGGFKFINKIIEMKKLLNIENLSRIHIVSPNHDEINQIVKKYNLHEIIEQDLKESNTQDKIDVYDDHIFLVLHFPKYQIKKNKHYSNEFKFILTKNFLLSFSTTITQTIEKIKKEYLANIANINEEDLLLKTSPYYVLYKIIDALYDKTLVSLMKFNKDLMTTEEDIFDGDMLGSQLLETLIRKSRNISFLKNLMQPHSEIIEELNNATKKFYEWDLDVYFEDLEYKVDKITNKIWNLSEHTESLSNKYNTLVTLRTNATISVLTIVTVIVGFLTLITGFYGMNVRLPWQKWTAMRIAVGIGMLILAGIMLLLFRKKKWL